MATKINTHLGKNIEWIVYRNGYNAFQGALTLNGSAYDISGRTFTAYFRTPDGKQNKLTLTEGSGIINGGDTGLLTIELTEATIATFPRDRYFIVVEYTIDGKDFPLIQGYINIVDETNPGATTTAVTIPVNISSVQVNMDVTLVARTSITSEAHVDDFGAIVSGETDASAIIQAAIDSVGTYGKVYFNANKTYIIDEQVTFPIGIDFIGPGAIIKRKDAIFTTTTELFALGATSITVANTAGFKVGDKIIVCDITLPHGGRGHLENSATSSGTTPQTITEISGNTITFTNGLGRECPIGSTVVKIYDLFKGGATTITVPGLGNKFSGITFDANKTNNNHTNSWVFNRTINDIPSKSIIDRCTFHDTPGENIFISNQTTVRDCHFYDLNGSFVHISQATSSNSGSNLIIGNKIRGACQATNDVTGHSEGAVTFSASPDKVMVIGNEVRDCAEAFLSPMSHLSPFLLVHDNQAFNCNGIVTVNNFDSTLTRICKNFSLKNNVFHNCGWMTIDVLSSLLTNQLVEKNLAVDLITISDNEFTNVKLSLNRVSGFSILKNRFITESDHVYSSSDPVASLSATINITRCTQYEIDGNTFDNRATAPDSRLTTAINCEYAFNLNLANAQEVKTNASTNTEYVYYNRNSSVRNNRVFNYTLGILDYYPGSEILPARSLSWIGFEIAGNMVVLRPSGAIYGIVVGPGAVAHDNKIYSVSTNVAAMVVLGVNDGSGSTQNNGGTQSTRLNGAIAYNNTIIGANTSIQVGSLSASFGNNTYNAIVQNNYVDGTVTDNTSGNSTIANNTSLVNESLTLQVLRTNPEYY